MFSESQMIAKMKVLVVFLLAVLDCSLTEGRLVPKCELWGELKNVTANLTLNGNNLVAKREYWFYIMTTEPTVDYLCRYRTHYICHIIKNNTDYLFKITPVGFFRQQVNFSIHRCQNTQCMQTCWF